MILNDDSDVNHICQLNDMTNISGSDVWSCNGMEDSREIENIVVLTLNKNNIPFLPSPEQQINSLSIQNSTITNIVRS